jgi:type IV fimbrial biogenesis protein FimT
MRMRAVHSGFGLIELIIGIAIVAILTALALPSFREIGMRMSTSEHTNDLVGALTMAKAEAAKRGVIAGVVGAGSDWSAGGWQVLVDSNSDSVLTGADTVIARFPPLTDQYAVKTKVTGGNDAQVVFSAQGTLSVPSTQVDINVCRPDHQAAESAWIHVVPSGEITSRRNTASSPAPGC